MNQLKKLEAAKAASFGYPCLHFLSFKHGFWESSCYFISIRGFVIFCKSLAFIFPYTLAKKIWYSMILAISFRTKLTRLSLSLSMARSIIFLYPKTLVFDHLVQFSEGKKNLELHILVHQLRHQDGKSHYFLKPKSKLLDLLV